VCDVSLTSLQSLARATTPLLTYSVDGAVCFFKQIKRGFEGGTPLTVAKGLGVGTAKVFQKPALGIAKFLSETADATRNATQAWVPPEQRVVKRVPECNNVVSGLFHGTRRLGKGVLGGVWQLFFEPYRGAVKGGGRGFARGVGKGVTAVASKPIAGMLDFVCLTSQGTYRSTTWLFQRKWRKEPRGSGAAAVDCTDEEAEQVVRRYKEVVRERYAT